ncbi:nucleotidyltransferase family protein [Alicyclobacillus macrosporangiidus]|uniref:nucleotidyltransferase family protein n=1 Tax=Alicyclobacillus macrosporangiidus TaxID=392015 RepID=UPI0009F80890|nr:nucleotidyltransferase family protein [Alicyclobacillus macrosporangiidus]
MHYNRSVVGFRSVRTEGWDLDPRIHEHRDEIFRIAAKYRAHNVRIFGSQALGEETENSDLGLLVDFEEPNLLDRIGMKQDLEALLGIRVDLLTEENLHPAFREQILAEAKPL